MTISVVIPIYNVSSYVERCIRSVMMQTYTDFECILVDDASQDDSLAKCEKLIAAYNGPVRFRILRHQQNRGLSAARNTGTDAAKGDYILYVDSDDEITKDCIEKLIAPLLCDDSIEVVMGNFEDIPEGDSLPVKSPETFDDKDIKGLETVRQYFYDRKEINLYVWNKLIKRDFICHHNLLFRDGILWEDLVWTFYLAKYLSRIYIISDVTYLKCQRPSSISMGTDKLTKYHHYVLVYNDISSHFTPEESYREAKFYIRRFFRDCLGCRSNELLRKTTQNFRRQLSVWHDPVDCFLLLSSDLLSRSKMGIRLFHYLRQKYHRNASPIIIPVTS